MSTREPSLVALTLHALCGIASIRDEAHPFYDYHIEARKIIRDLPVIHHEDFGSLCGSNAFIKATDFVGHQKDSREKAMKRANLLLYVECPKHGYSHADIGHVFPCSLGGMLGWDGNVMHNAIAECGICNRAKRAKLTNEQVAWLKKFKLPQPVYFY